MPLVRPLVRDLWEVRSSLPRGRIARVIFCVERRNRTSIWRSGGRRERGHEKENIGSTFDSWLREEGLYEEVSANAIKRVVSRQVEDAMKEKKLTRTEMARRMHTSRACRPQRGK
jgi:hypothetical protein